MLQHRHINYQLLGNAQRFYKSKGYKYIEIPWIIPQESSEITCPDLAKAFTLNYNDKLSALTASAEQSFLSLIGHNSNIVNEIYYQSITPCFRNESLDDLHSKWFMKLELFKWYDIDTTKSGMYPEFIRNELNILIEDALAFFKKQEKSFLFGPSDFKVEYMGKWSYDILYKDIEVGSYGIKSHENITWIYGTGLAEPRFSFVTSR